VIFEALSALADGNGSDVSSIYHFIEVWQISLCYLLCTDQKIICARFVNYLTDY